MWKKKVTAFFIFSAVRFLSGDVGLDDGKGRRKPRRKILRARRHPVLQLCDRDPPDLRDLLRQLHVQNGYIVNAMRQVRDIII